MQKLVSVLGASLALASATAFAQTEAIRLKSDDTTGDIPRLVVTTSTAAGVPAELRVQDSYLRFTETSSGYLLTVENTIDSGLYFDAADNLWSWRGGGSDAATLDLDDGTLTVQGAIDSASLYRLAGVRVLETAAVGNTYVGRSGAGAGDQNTYIGEAAGQDMTTGSRNVLVGYHAGVGGTVGVDNVMLGNDAGGNVAGATSAFNVFVGSQAGFGGTPAFSNTGDSNTLIGHRSGYLLSTGDRNVCVGFQSGEELRIGRQNVFVGARAGRRNDQGEANTFVGAFAGNSNVGADFSTFVGSNAGRANVNGHYNTYVGAQAGMNATGDSNVFLGFQAGLNETLSNRLIITNVDTATPLIQGNFAVPNVTINGTLSVTGTLSKGGGSFLIDHPLDPRNMILRHSFVESPEMLNIYKGRARLSDGVAVITLPPYFDALNASAGREVYLSCVGSYSPLYLASMESDRFEVRAGPDGRADQEFTWTLFAVRGDPYAVANPIRVEERKGGQSGFPAGELIHPEAYCQRAPSDELSRVQSHARAPAPPTENPWSRIATLEREAEARELRLRALEHRLTAALARLQRSDDR